MARPPIPTWFYVLVVVRREDRFLMIREPSHGHNWYLPAGRVEPGEDLASAARRETLEESGIPVVLDGILRIEHNPRSNGTSRVRVIYLAHPVDDRPPKHHADEHSIEAAWVSLDELDRLSLRDPEVKRLFRHVARGATAYPLNLLADEGAPYP